MDPVWRALLQSWGGRFEIILLLLSLGGLYTVGWLRLRRRRRYLLATGWRIGGYWLGLSLIGLALMSPLDSLASQLFAMHMVQHLLLVMGAPSLLLLAQPFPLLLWGLPQPLRRRIGGWFKPTAPFRVGLTRLTGPIWIWLAFNGIIWAWHWPAAYNAALQSEFVHDLEHLTFFGGALLFWWQVIAVGPRLHGRFSRSARIGYLLATTPSNVLLGMLIALADQPIYTYYLTVPRLWGLTVMQDQMLGGAIMWVPGSMMYIVAAVILLIRLLRESEQAAWPGNDQDTPSLNARQI